MGMPEEIGSINFEKWIKNCTFVGCYPITGDKVSMKRCRKVGILIPVLLSLGLLSLQAQTGAFSTYSPYSVFGVGEVMTEGTAFNKTMGGVGIAARNNRYINYLNPAAITARDTLAFMLDFGVSNNNKYFRQGDVTSVNNQFNICNFILSVPIYRSSALAIGITPYSGVGYDFSYSETRSGIIGNTGNIDYQSYGEGAMTKVFLSAAATFWKRFSVGAELDYYFGHIGKVSNKIFEQSSFRSTYGGYDMKLWGIGGKFGIQYEHRFNNLSSLTAGATYRLKTPIRGTNEEYYNATLSSVQDTIYRRDVGSQAVRLGDEIGVGLALRLDGKWSIEVDYLLADWRSSGFSSARGFAVNTEENLHFESVMSHTVRAGVEFVPNRNDIRYYYRRMAYRAGLYYDTGNFRYGPYAVTSYGLTLGVTLPVFRWFNGFTIGMEIGRKGSVQNNMIRETCFQVHVSMNIHDIWFQKPKYE